jgi:small multidrug resistance pump
MKKGRVENLFLVGMFIIYALLSAGGLVLFKIGGESVAVQANPFGFTVTLSWKTVIGIICYLLSFLLWLIIVSKTQLSFAMPLSVGVVNMLVFLGSAYFLNEQITPMKIVGLVIIIIGLFLITLSGKK